MILNQGVCGYNKASVGGRNYCRVITGTNQGVLRNIQARDGALEALVLAERTYGFCV
jgi:hypothetical protein